MEFPDSPNDPDKDSLPDPKLNPLLNPLLGANMGRWAEVYFTTPPEKRDEAVAELVKELETASPSEEGLTPIRGQATDYSLEHGKVENGIEANEATSDSSQEDAASCPECGQENAVEQKFCGMCGSPMRPFLPEIETSQGVDTPRNSSDKWNEFDLSQGGNVSYSDPSYPISADADERYRQQEPTEHISGGDIPSFAVEPEPVPYRYRVYVGTALAILLGVLLYMAWRGTTTFTGGAVSAPSRAIPAAPPAAPTTAAAEPPAVAKQPVLQPPRNSNNVVPTESSPPPMPLPQPETKSRQEKPIRQPSTARKLAPQAVPAATASGQSGAEELATAEKYLAGRDGSQAASWLWKAVAKGNVAATITLSDLYLRGDGVPKNCDQAHLLLDAAARKGGKAAGERLRNLQAFG